MAKRHICIGSFYSDSGDDVGNYSPDILAEDSENSHSCPESPEQNGHTPRRLTFEGVPLRNTTNVTPLGPQRFSTGTSSEPPRPIRSRVSGDNVQTQLFEILSEVKKTNSKVENFEEKFVQVERRLKNLEQLQTPSSSEGSSEIQKRKVPAHVRVCLVHVSLASFLNKIEC